MKKKISSGLIIRERWLNNIFRKYNKKTWEIRGSNTHKRGRIALIQSGSRKIVGTCEIIDVIGHLSLKELKKNMNNHQATIQEIKDLKYRKIYAWVLKNAKKLKKPITYKYPLNLVRWVKLSNIDL